MIPATGWVVIAQWFDRVLQILGDPPNPARSKWALPLAVAVLALVPSAARSEAPAVRDAAMEEPSDLPKTDVAKPSLPPRALVRIGTDLLRVPGGIRSFALSPGGRLVAAGDLHAPSPRIMIFDVRTGRQAKQFVTPGNQGGWVETAAFSPDGTKLLWGEMSGEVALWDLSADRLLFRRKLHRGNVMDVKFSPDGRLFASGGLEGVVHLRSVEKPEDVIRDFAMPTLGHLAFTPDGTRLVAGGQFSTIISVWRLSDGQLLRQIGPTAGDHLTSIAVTTDSQRILSAGHRKDPPTEKAQELRRLPGLVGGEIPPPPPPQSSPSSPSVERTEIRLWDIETGARLRDLNGAAEIGIGDVALSPDGRRMAIVNFSGLRMLDTSTLKPQWTTDLPGWWGRPTAFSSDGRLVALPEQNAVAIFEVATGRRLHHDESTPVGRVGAAAWSPSGDRIVTGHPDGFVRVWDAATGKLIWCKLMAPVVTLGGQSADPIFVGFSRDGKQLIAAGHRDDPAKSEKGIVGIYEAADGRTVREVPRKEFRRTALVVDGRFVVVAYDDLLVGVEVATGQIRWSSPTVNQPETFVEVAAFQFEARPPWFQAAMKNGNVIRFNGLTGHEQRRFLADGRTLEQQRAARRGKPVMSTAAFSADGRTMASSYEGWVCMWDVAAGTLRRRIRYPHSRDCLLALAPDGKTVATSDVPNKGDYGEDKIHLYDAETGEPVLTLEPADDRAKVLAFSPDGTKLLTGFQRGSVIVWDVRRGQAAPRAKE